MRILLLSSNYAPEVAGIAVYSTGLAEGLATRGHEVEVVSAFPHYPEWRATGRVPFRAETRNGVKVRRAMHFVPGKLDLAHRVLFELSLLPAHAASLPIRRPDVILGVVPTLAAGVVTRTASLLYRRPYGLVLQDVMTQASRELGVRGQSAPTRLISIVEGAIARRADGIAIVAGGFRGQLARWGVDDSVVVEIPNWGAYTSPTRSPTFTRQQHGWAPEDVVCLYAGSMGFKHGLEVFVDAARLCPSQVRIVLAGDGSEKANLVARARRLGARVEFLPPTLPGEYESLLEAADVLLLSQRNGVKDMSIASKVGSYARSGRPIVACLPAVSETRSALHNVRGTSILPAEDPRALVAALAQFKGGCASAPRRPSDAHATASTAPADLESALDAYSSFIGRIYARAGRGHVVTRDAAESLENV